MTKTGRKGQVAKFTLTSPRCLTSIRAYCCFSYRFHDDGAYHLPEHCVMPLGIHLANAPVARVDKRRPIAIAADHAGFELKEDLKTYLRQAGYTLLDFGTFSETPVDYPDLASKLAKAVSAGTIKRGILICGTGLGMSIVANRFPQVRAALCGDIYTARVSREHNDANVLILGGRVVGKGLARDIVQTWMQTTFSKGRHQQRLNKLKRLEEDLTAKGGRAR